jgi:hypothetical protein
MATIAEIRQQYPQYADMDDATLGKALHAKYYADMPYDDFAQRVGLGSVAPASSGPPRRYVKDKTAQMGGLELAGRGAGKFIRDMATGLEQRFLSGEVAQGTPGAAERADVLTTRASVDRVKDRNLMEKGPAKAGYVGSALATTVPMAFLPGANTLPGAMGIGAFMGAAQPTAEGENWQANAGKGAAWGLAGQAAANTLGRVAKPIKTAFTPREQKAVALLKKEGVPLTAAQQTGSQRAMQVERGLADNPVTQPAMSQAFLKRQEAFTKAVVRTFGENADNAGPAVLDRAAKRIGGGMDDFAAKYQPDMSDPRVLKEIADVEQEALRLRGAAGDNRVQIQIDRIRALSQGGKMDGKSYQSLNRELSKLARDPDSGEYAYRLKEALDDALQKAAGPEAKEIKRLRSQWRNLKAVEQVADGTERAQVSGPALAQHLKSSKFTRNSFRYGRGDTELSKLARGMNTIIDKFPQSGTAPRVGNQMVVPALAGAGGAAFGEGSAEDRMMNAAKWAAAGYLVPKAGVGLMTNPRAANYLAGANPGLVRNALALPSKAGTGALVPAYLLSQQ